jgi:hypothetical protein
MPRMEAIRGVRRGASWVGLVALALVLAACGAPLAELDEGELLVVNEGPETLNLKAGGTTLAGQTVSGTIIVTFSAGWPISSVAFHLDDPERGSPPRRVDATSPFTITLDTTGLSNGEHVLTAVASGRRTVVRHARFVVRNAATSPSEPAPSPAPSPAPGGPSASDVLWYADHEGGSMAQWSANGCGGIFNNGGATASTSTRVARNGRYSAQMTIQNVSGDQGARLFRWCESRSHADLYYSTWMFFPTTFQATAGWWNVFQFKSKTPTRNDPFFILNISNTSSGAMRFYLYDWQQRRSYTQSAMEIPVGRWVHLEVRHRSSSGTDGRVTVWQDGVQLFDVSGVRTRYADGDQQWSLAHYTSSISPDPSTIYVDDVAISRTRLGPQTNLATLMAPRTAAIGGE